MKRALLATLVLVGCGGGSGSSGPTCDTFMACGGNVVGTWKVQKLCAGGMGLGAFCPTAQVDTAGIVYAGTMTFGVDMTYSSSTMTSGTAKVLLPLSCIQAISPAAAGVKCAMLGLLLPLVLPKDSPVQGIACTDSTAMMAACDCQLTFKPDAHMSSGTYRVDGSTLTQMPTGSTTPVVSDFCGTGSNLSIKGQPPTAPMSGSMLDLSAVQVGTVILGK